MYSPLEMILSKLNYNKEISRYFKNAKLVEENKEEEEDMPV